MTVGRTAKGERAVSDAAITGLVAEHYDWLLPNGGAFACLAPDDSTIVLGIGIDGGGATASDPRAALGAPEGGTWFEIKGSFAGWLEIARYRGERRDEAR